MLTSRPLPIFAWSFALVLAGAVSGRAEAQEPPLQRLPCGEYEAVPSGVGPSGRPTRLSILKAGRLLLNVSDWSIMAVDCQDISGDKTPELLVRSFSGGAHCCETLRVWTLGPSPRLALEFESGNASGFTLRDLDADGRRELVLGDDSFAYFDDLSYAVSPVSLPLVACFTDRRVEDCTRRFPALLTAERQRYVERLLPPVAADHIKETEGAALAVLALSVLLGEEERGVETIRQAVSSDAVMAWIERARPKVRDWADTRGRKLKNARQ